MKKYGNKKGSEGGDVKISKNLAYLLRHGALKEGLNIRSDGYVKVTELLNLPFYKSQKIGFEKIKEIVDTNDKKRYELSEEVSAENVKEWWIRASQGHTLKEVNDEELLEKITDSKEYPICVHGTTLENWKVIQGDGLRPMGRNHVHFAIGYPGEKEVISGMRKSCKVFIELDLEKALQDGMEIFISSNKVILTSGINQHIPPKYFKKVIVKEGETWKESKLVLNNSSNEKSMNVEESKSDEKQEKSEKNVDGDFDFLCAIDFEAQCQDGVNLDIQEIVEFPIVVVDCKQKKIIDKFHTYIKPVVHPKLYPFCTELTGITQDKVDGGILLEDALKEVDKFLTDKGILSSRWCFVSCGDWDLKTCLRKESKAKKIQLKEYMKSWINLKNVYPGGPVRGMTDALKLSGLDLLGRHHSGIDDTINIARVIVYLLEKNFAFTSSMINRLL